MFACKKWLLHCIDWLMRADLADLRPSGPGVLCMKRSCETSCMFEPLQGRWHISCSGSLPHDDLHLLLITVQQHTLIYSRRLPLQDKWCRWDVFWLKTPAVSNSFPQTDKPSSYLPDPDLNLQIDPFFPPYAAMHSICHCVPSLPN